MSLVSSVVHQRSTRAVPKVAGTTTHAVCSCSWPVAELNGGGQVIGESDDTASGPRHEGISPDDVAASFYYNLGIDPTIEYHSSSESPDQPGPRRQHHSEAVLIVTELSEFADGITCP